MAKSKKPLVIVTRKLPDSVELRMRELFDARLNPEEAAAKIADSMKGQAHVRAGAAALGLLPKFVEQLLERQIAAIVPWRIGVVMDALAKTLEEH